MKKQWLWMVLAIFLCLPLVPAGSHAERIYVSNFNSDRVTVLDSVTYQVAASIPVGDQPQGIALNVDGSRAYGNVNRKLTICDNRILTTPERV